jgi:hypothetical protein
MPAQEGQRDLVDCHAVGLGDKRVGHFMEKHRQHEAQGEGERPDSDLRGGHVRPHGSHRRCEENRQNGHHGERRGRQRDLRTSDATDDPAFSFLHKPPPYGPECR